MIESFLTANPTEVVTLFLEDYVASANGLSNAFEAAGLKRYWFPAASMPKNGGDWPTLREMVARNWRLIVFTSRSAKELEEGIAYEWNYVVENQCKLVLATFVLSCGASRGQLVVLSCL